MPRPKREPNQFKADQSGCITLLGTKFYLSDKLAGETVKIYIDKFEIYAVTKEPTIRYALVRDTRECSKK
jgi:hypothetical protein